MPSYAGSSAPTPGSDASPTPGPGTDDPPLPAGIRPTNMLLISHTNKAIKGTWVIDPTLPVPDAVLPRLAHGEARKNVSLESRNGAINADIRVVRGSTAGADAKARTTMRFAAHNGSITVKLVSTHPSSSPPLVDHAGTTLFTVSRVLTALRSASPKTFRSA